MPRGDLRVVDPPFGADDRPTERNRETAVGVVLVAGIGSRYEAENKLRTEWAGAPIVRHATATIQRFSVDATVVVLGYDVKNVREAVDGSADAVVRNVSRVSLALAERCECIGVDRDAFDCLSVDSFVFDPVFEWAEGAGPFDLQRVSAVVGHLLVANGNVNDGF
jgi:hypothetical protein